MRRHQTFRSMLARRRDLKPGEERRLQDHLSRCEECQSLVTVYAEQDLLLAPLRQVRAPAGVRAEVLQAAGRGHAAGRGFRFGAPVPVVAAICLVLLAIGIGLVSRSGGQHPSQAAQVLNGKGYRLLAPQGDAAVSRKAAERIALALFPGEVHGTLLSAVRNDRTAPFRSRPRLCWIVSITPVSGTGLVPPGTLLDGSPGGGDLARVQYFLVFVDAKRGNVVLASSAAAA